MLHTLTPMVNNFIIKFQKKVKEYELCFVLQKEAFKTGRSCDTTRTITGVNCGGVIIWYEKITTLHEEILELSRIIIRYTGHTTGMSDTSNKIDNIYKESTKLTEEYTKLIKY